MIWPIFRRFVAGFFSVIVNELGGKLIFHLSLKSVLEEKLGVISVYNRGAMLSIAYKQNIFHACYGQGPNRGN